MDTMSPSLVRTSLPAPLRVAPFEQGEPRVSVVVRTSLPAPLRVAPFEQGEPRVSVVVRVTGTSCPWTRRYSWRLHVSFPCVAMKVDCVVATRRHSLSASLLQLGLMHSRCYSITKVSSCLILAPLNGSCMPNCFGGPVRRASARSTRLLFAIA